jgi:hypothetical protein
MAMLAQFPLPVPAEPLPIGHPINGFQIAALQYNQAGPLNGYPIPNHLVDAGIQQHVVPHFWQAQGVDQDAWNRM